MKKSVLLAALLALAGSSAAAQPASQPDALLRKDVRELIEITGAAALGAQMSEQMLTSLRPLFDQAYPDVPIDVLNALFEEMRVEVGQADMAALVGPVYERHFTHAEIKGLLAFYKTPLGQRSIELMPVIMRESMAAGQEWGEAAGRRAAETVVQRLRERGYASGK
ncbi:MAG TPA: DUF2059 domain-containing protein [Rubricoccaceae bacterium]|jgi:hypothetical protein